MIKKIILFFLLLVSPAQASVDVYFSPTQDLEKQWVEMIGEAKEYIAISCFGMTNENIFNALLQKKKAGVKILVLEDKMQSGSKHDMRDKLIAAGIEVVVKKVQVLEHNKVLLVDGKDAIIGSWNLSNSAQAQDNSIAVFRDEPEIAYKVRWAINAIYQRDH